ncbi:PAS domain S-box protein [Algoriphagus namhaensis]
MPFNHTQKDSRHENFLALAASDRELLDYLLQLFCSNHDLKAAVLVVDLRKGYSVISSSGWKKPSYDELSILQTDPVSSDLEFSPVSQAFRQAHLDLGLEYYFQKGFNLENLANAGFLYLFSDKQIKNPNVESLLVQLATLISKASKAAKLDQVNDQLKKTIRLFNESQRINQVGAWELDLETGKTLWTEEVFAIHEVDSDFDHNKDANLNFYHPEDRHIIVDALDKTFETGEPFDVICRFITAKNNHKWVRATGFVWKENNAQKKLIGSFQDITIQKENRDALLLEQNRVKSILEGTHAGTWEVNMLTGQARYNNHWAEMVGYRLDELAPLDADTWKSLVHSEDLQLVNKNLKECLNGKRERLDLEIRLHHKAGHFIWVHVLGKVLSWTSDQKPLMVYGIQQDITSRKNLERERIYNEGILRKLFKLSPIGIALNDFETGQYLDINDKLLEPTGYTKEEFIQLSYWDLTPKEYEPKEKIALESMRTKWAYDAFEKEYIRKDGTRYPIELRGIVVEDLNGKKLIWSFVEDISEKKRARQELTNALGQLEAIMDASTQVTLISTDPKGLITYFNKGAEQALGFSAGEVVGKMNLADLHSKKEIEKALQQFSDEDSSAGLLEILSAKGQPDSKPKNEWTYQRKDSSSYPALVSTTQISREGEHLGYLSVGVNISLIKKAEEELRSILEITQDQNDRLRNFAQIVSHNLRSHAGGLSSLLDLISADDNAFAEDEMFSYLRMASDNLMETIENLTEVVKINLASKEERKTVNLRKEVDKVTSSLFSLTQVNEVEIRNEVDGAHRLDTIPAYMESILMNFVTNAIKYRSPHRPSELIIHSQKTKENLELRFKDNGVGIDLEKNGDKLFGMYKTFHKHPDARGVGLFITKNQIEALGGTVSVESTLGEGTEFTLTFPLGED